LLLRVVGIRVHSKVTRAVFTAGLLGLPLCLLVAEWTDGARGL
jgi:hypothetical protein